MNYNEMYEEYQRLNKIYLFLKNDLNNLFEGLISKLDEEYKLEIQANVFHEDNFTIPVNIESVSDKGLFCDTEFDTWEEDEREQNNIVDFNNLTEVDKIYIIELLLDIVGENEL